MRKDRRKCLRRSLSERPQKRAHLRKHSHNGGGYTELDWTFHSNNDSNKITRRAGMKTRKMGGRKPKHITRLESMKNVFDRMGLSANQSTVEVTATSSEYRHTWPSITNSMSSIAKRITRRHSFAIESLIRPSCAEFEEHTGWSSGSCILENTDGGELYTCRPSGTAAVFLDYHQQDGLHYWKGSATITSPVCCVFGHKSIGEWKYITNVSGVLKYQSSDHEPNVIDLEQDITDPRVFYYENGTLISAVQQDCVIGIGTTKEKPSLELKSKGTRSASKWKY